MTDNKNECNFSNMTNRNNYYSYILYYIILYYIIVIYNISKMTDEKSATVLLKKIDVLTAKTMSGKLLVPGILKKLTLLD